MQMEDAPSNKWAGSLQMGPRWWHYLSSGMEPREGCWERVGARLGQPSVPWRAGLRPEGWCRVDSELWPATGLAEVGTLALTPAPDVCRAQGSLDYLGVVCALSSLRGAEPGGRATAAPGWVFTFELRPCLQPAGQAQETRCSWEPWWLSPVSIPCHISCMSQHQTPH